ncbi:MAG TPA: TA system VapC family ribonuclease toxin [Xanthobacteraceae bacterium]
MRALFDVNLLIALFQPDHVHYREAHEWWHANQKAGWASCPLTQNSFVRILSQLKHAGPTTVGGALDLLKRATDTPHHAFWPDDISLPDIRRIDRERILGPKQLTDIYLLALAVKNGGSLVTFDRSIPIGAVRNAKPQHIIVI